jgi:uncharacterized protein YbaR (Trm112 family)
MIKLVCPITNIKFEVDESDIHNGEVACFMCEDAEDFYWHKIKDMVEIK